MGMGGGMMGGGMMGGGMMMGNRPEKKARLEAVKEIEKGIAALKEAVNKAPDKDPNIATLTGDALTKFMDLYAPESNAINTISNAISGLRGSGGMMGGMMRMGGPSTDVLNELKTLATGDKAAKTTARIDALIKEAQQREEMMQGGGMMGGGMMGGMGAPGGAPGGAPAGGAPAGGAPAGRAGRGGA
jgi:hypothetical protein